MFFRTAQLPVVKRTVQEIQINHTSNTRPVDTPPDPRESARDSNVSLDDWFRQRFTTISKIFSGQAICPKRLENPAGAGGVSRSFGPKQTSSLNSSIRHKVLVLGNLSHMPGNKIDFSEIFFEPPSGGVRRTYIEQDEPPSLCARATIWAGWLEDIGFGSSSVWKGFDPLAAAGIPRRTKVLIRWHWSDAGARSVVSSQPAHFRLWR